MCAMLGFSGRRKMSAGGQAVFGGKHIRRPRGSKLLESDCFDELAILQENFSLARVTGECG
jgi:hypothetical protein